MSKKPSIVNTFFLSESSRFVIDATSIAIFINISIVAGTNLLTRVAPVAVCLTELSSYVQWRYESSWATSTTAIHR